MCIHMSLHAPIRPSSHPSTRQRMILSTQERLSSELHPFHLSPFRWKLSYHTFKKLDTYMTSMHTCMPLHAHRPAYIYICIYLYIYICIHIFIYIYKNEYVFMVLQIDIHIYLSWFRNIYTHINLWWRILVVPRTSCVLVYLAKVHPSCLFGSSFTIEQGIYIYIYREYGYPKRSCALS